jgi:hypothetical protein
MKIQFLNSKYVQILCKLLFLLYHVSHSLNTMYLALLNLNKI